MEIIRFLALVSIILLIDLCFVILFNIKFGKALPITFIFLVFIQYVSALLGKLSYLKFVLGPILLLAVIFVVVSIKKKKVIYKNFFNISFLIFILLFTYLYFLLRNGTYSNIDDLYYYGRVVKDCFTNDALYSDSDILSVRPIYPPFSTLLEIFFCKILGGMKEGFTIFALSSYALSFFMFVFDKFEYVKKDIIKSLLLFVGVLFVLNAVQVNRDVIGEMIFNSIYLDWIIAITLAFLIYQVYDLKFETKEYIYLAIIAAAFIEYKSIAIPLYLMVLTLLLVKIILNKKSIKTIVLLFMLFVILPIIIVLFRQNYQNRYMYVNDNVFNYIKTIINMIKSGIIFNTQNTMPKIDQWPANISALATVSNIVATPLKATSEAMSVYSNFINALIEFPIMTRPFNLSYIFIIVIETILMFIFVRKDYIQKYFLIIVFILGSIGYSFCVAFTMNNGMITSNGLYLDEFGRYMQLYTYFGVVLLFMLFIEKENISTKHLIIVDVALALIIEPVSIKQLALNRDWYKQKEKPKIENWITNIYLPIAKDKKIGIISNNDVEYYHLLRFCLDKKDGDAILININNKTTLEDFKESLSQCDYLLIGYYDENIGKLWKSVTSADLMSDTMYKIQINSQGKIEITVEECFGE